MRLFLVVLFIALRSFGAQSQEPLDHGRLFKVEVPGVAPSYVFGTFHNSSPEILTLPSAVRKAFAESGTLALEIVMDPASAGDLVGQSLLPMGRSLKEILGDASFGELADILDEVGIPSHLADRLEPWFVMTIIALSPDELARQYQGLLMLDDWLEQEAFKQGKDVLGLEVAEEQLRILRDLPRWFQAAALVASIKSYGDSANLEAEMIALYLSGDMTGLLHKLREAFGAGFVGWFAEQRLLVVRNHRMAERAVPYLDKGGVFIAVGAGHLGGEEGLLQLLRDRGYKVSRAD